MKNNYLITITGKHTADGRVNDVSLSTFGDYRSRGGRHYIRYIETEATGFAGDVTTFMLEGGRRAMLQRKGKSNSRLIIEKDHKHVCHYETVAGALAVGILGDVIDNQLDECGGSASLRYRLDVNSSLLSINEINITVKEHHKCMT